MKTQYFVKYILALLIIFSGTIAQAQRPHARPAKRAAVKSAVANKVQARKVIRRTAIVIHHAQKHVRINKNYTGDLSRAVAHQRFARKLYARGLFRRAIHHSRVARVYAHRAIKANKGSDIAEAALTAEEEALIADSPSEEALMEELIKEDEKPVIDDAKMLEAGDVDLGENE